MRVRPSIADKVPLYPPEDEILISLHNYEVQVSTLVVSRKHVNFIQIESVTISTNTISNNLYLSGL